MIDKMQTYWLKLGYIIMKVMDLRLHIIFFVIVGIYMLFCIDIHDIINHPQGTNRFYSNYFC